MSRTAILAGEGRLPQAVAAALGPARCLWVTITDLPAPPGIERLAARFERLGEMFAAMREKGVTAMVFAGAIRRPQVDPALLDPFARGLAAHFARGDDALLREVLALFERQGFPVLSPREVAPELGLDPGTLWGRGWDAQAQADAERARAVLDALAPLDVGQCAAAAAGQVLGIETIQGTEALLDFVARTDPALKRAPGVFVKAPKAGQELRLDMPAIGPETVAQVAAAGLGGLVIDAAGVLVIDREETRRAVEAAGLFLCAR